LRWTRAPSGGGRRRRWTRRGPRRSGRPALRSTSRPRRCARAAAAPACLSGLSGALCCAGAAGLCMFLCSALILGICGGAGRGCSAGLITPTVRRRSCRTAHTWSTWGARTTWCRASPTPRLCRSCDGARCAGCRPALWVRGWRQGRLRGLATDCELPCRAVCCFLITAIICADGNCMPSGGLLCLLHVASEMMIVDLLLQTGAQINVHLCHKCWDSEAPAPAGARDRSLQHTPGHDGRHVHAGGLHGQDRGGREPRAG